MMMTASVPAPMYTMWLLRVGRLTTATAGTPSAVAGNCPRGQQRPTSLRRVDERARRIGENESYWRQVNELSPPEPGVLNFMFCECGRLECRERVEVTAEEYESVRARSTTFLVAPGHAIVDVETVNDLKERFEVVEKVGQAAQVAVENDTP